MEIIELTNPEVKKLREAVEYLLKKYPLESLPVETLILAMEGLIENEINHPVIVKAREMWEDGAESSWEWTYEIITV